MLNVLVVGSGGREHALAWKIAQSPLAGNVYIAPGNAGTACKYADAAPQVHLENIPVAAEDTAGLTELARTRNIDLVAIGPEAPLAAGLADALRAAGLRVFGPSQTAAQIEASKAFAKEFMARHNIPTAGFAVFRDFEAACRHLRRADCPLVIKASGLAAGKGVIVPESIAEAEAALRRIMLDREFGTAGAEVVLEERLSGEEVSLLALTDGVTVRPLVPSQDHKRVLDGDQGPNTGGMGAYAPVPACPPALVDELTRTVLQPAVDGLRAEGRPFVGLLYAGLMLTAAGPRVVEFNCRFGDPETQVVLPLLESDLLDLLLACAEGRLAEKDVIFKPGAAACVVLASGGYPGKYAVGRPVSGLEFRPHNAVIFHAGTRLADGQVVTAGGRVLCVTGWGPDISAALEAAYFTVGKISFEGMHYRKDIGWRAIGRGVHTAAPQPAANGARNTAGGSTAYAAAGVDIDAGNRAVDLMRAAVRSTYGPQVLAGIGAFGGLFDAAALQAMRAPVLVASTDGVGTKVKLAAQTGRYASIGHDLVNHCVNDILVQGARPLFFLDYIASSRLRPEMVAEIVDGLAAACRAAGCALLGGETAEMPGVYAPDEFDLAGTIVGVVERERILPRGDVHAGDVLVGLRSSGPHTNGYSLIRRIFADVPPDTVFPELGSPLAEALLAPHRSYLPVVQAALEAPNSPVKALAHITGGGFFDNIPRILPDGVGAVVRRGTWPVSPIFDLIRRRGNVAEEEMYRVFNMGIGLVIIVAPENIDVLQKMIKEEIWPIGEVIAGEKKVTLA